MPLNDSVDIVRLTHYNEKQNKRIAAYEVVIVILGLCNLGLWILAMKG